MGSNNVIEVPISGMDCADCTRHVKHAISRIEGVKSVEVLLGAEKALITTQNGSINLAQVRKAVSNAGYSVPIVEEDKKEATVDTSRRLLTVLAVVVGLVLFVAVGGEWLGLFEALTDFIPFGWGAAVVTIAGLPIFIDVVRAALQRQITSRTLMTLGFIAALAVGQWTTAGVLVFMMHVGNYVENFTAKRSRNAVRDLAAMIPQTARVERDGRELIIPIGELLANEIVVVRPGEKIPVDGEIIRGEASINQSAITGESMPVDGSRGVKVYAASLVQSGSISVKATHVGKETTFGKVIRLVEEAESQKGNVQLFADRFSSYYLPIVAGIGLLTLIVRRDPLAAAAVLVVACSCSIALATPIAVMASIGAAARRGLMIKGGKYLEQLAKADILLIDKTGTLTLGEPQITEVIPLNGGTEGMILQLAASAERYSEHPLAHAIRAKARERHIKLLDASNFQFNTGIGVKANIDGHVIQIGSNRSVKKLISTQFEKDLKTKGKTILYVQNDDELIGVLAAADTLRTEVPESIWRLKQLGVGHIELLTGDNAHTAAALGESLGIGFRADLLPEDKIAIVKDYQQEGKTVIMVGDGINDAPALAQADIGIAMGSSGTEIALEAADIALLREDWRLIPALIEISRRTMGVVRLNLIFTAIYNLVGISLAALGILPPFLAATVQSFPDLGILGNSSRLLKQK